jgi:hypothetical protein
MTYYCRIAFFFLSKTTEHGIDKPTVLNQRYITNLFECCGSVILRSRRGSRDLQLHDNDGSRLTTTTARDSRLAVRAKGFIDEEISAPSGIIRYSPLQSGSTVERAQ